MKRISLHIFIVLIVILAFTACDSTINEPKEEGAFKVGNSKYETLQEAVDSLKGSKDLTIYTITLTKDVSDRGAIISGIAGNVRLDFGIYKYTLENSSKGIKIDNGDTQVEIYGGVLAAGTGNTVAMLITSNSDTKITGTEVNISGANIDAIVMKKGTLSIEGDTVIKTLEQKKAITVSNNAVVAVVSRDVIINGDFDISDNAIVNIEQGTVTGGFLLSGNAGVNIYDGNITVTKLDCPEGSDELINLMGDATINTAGNDLSLETKLADVSHYHTFATILSKDASYHWYASTCGHDVVKDKARHIWDEGTVLTPAAGDKAGSIEYTCLVCGYTRTELLEPDKRDAIPAIVENFYNATDAFIKNNINNLYDFSLDPTKIKWNGSLSFNGQLPAKFSYTTLTYYENVTEYGSSSGYENNKESATLTSFKANPSKGLTDFTAEYTIKIEDGSSIDVTVDFVYSENDGLKTRYLISDGEDSYSLVYCHDYYFSYYQITASNGSVINVTNYYDVPDAISIPEIYAETSSLYNLVQGAFNLVIENSTIRVKTLSYNDGEISATGQGDLSLTILVDYQSVNNGSNYQLGFDVAGSFNIVLQAYGVEVGLGLSFVSGSFLMDNSFSYSRDYNGIWTDRSTTEVDVSLNRAEIDVSVSYQKLNASLDLTLTDIDGYYLSSNFYSNDNNTSNTDFSGSGDIGVNIYLSDGENEVKYEGLVGVEDISLDDIMGVDMVEAALDLAAFDLNALAKLFGATYRTVTSKINGKNVSIAVLFGSFVEAINNFNY